MQVQKRKKITVPRCSEAAVAYIQLKLRRKTVADKPQLSHTFYSIFNNLIMISFIEKKTLKFHFRKTRIFYTCFLCPLAKSFLTSEHGPIIPI